MKCPGLGFAKECVVCGIHTHSEFSICNKCSRRTGFMVKRHREKTKELKKVEKKRQAEENRILVEIGRLQEELAIVRSY